MKFKKKSTFGIHTKIFTDEIMYLDLLQYNSVEEVEREEGTD